MRNLIRDQAGHTLIRSIISFEGLGCSRRLYGVHSSLALVTPATYLGKATLFRELRLTSHKAHATVSILRDPLIDSPYE